MNSAHSPAKRPGIRVARRPLRNARGIKFYIVGMLVLLGLAHVVLLFNLTQYLQNIF